MEAPLLLCGYHASFLPSSTLNLSPPPVLRSESPHPCTVYKGNGRDPLNPNSYRGITLTSVLSKCPERIFLNRMDLPLSEVGFPHISQTAYHRGISCFDALFSTQESLLKFVRDGDSSYLCRYDLEKAFNRVEYATLLSHLYNLGIDGKCWRLLYKLVHQS